MLLLSISTVLCLSALATSNDGDEPTTWAQFRGPGGRGVAENTAALPPHLDPERNLLWKAAVPAGHSSPCIYGERIFLSGATEGELHTLCIDRTSGELIWQESVEAKGIERVHRVNSAATPTPVSDGERVYVYFGSIGLLCYSASGGEVQWERLFPIPRNTFGTAASPILADGKLIFISDANEGSFLEAIDPEMGDTIWKVERDSFRSGWATPTVWERDGVKELLIYGVWWLTAYNLEDGSERWAVPGLTDEPITMPAQANGLVYVTSYNMRSNPEVIGLPPFEELVAEHDRDGDGMLDSSEAGENKSILSRFDADGEGDHPLRIFFRFLDEDRDGKITAVEWKKIVAWLEGMEHANALMAIRPQGEEDPEIVWQEPQGVPECPSPLLYGRELYIIKNGGMLSCLDAEKGIVHYRERIDSRGPHYASPVGGDGKVYISSARGVVTVVQAGQELKVLSQTKLGERVMATPAIVDGKVYVRAEESLFAFGQR